VGLCGGLRIPILFSKVIMTTEQHEEALLSAGWTQWTDELSDGRKVKVPFWQYQGSAPWYFNEAKQSEYINTERRYTLKEATRIHRLLGESVIILEARRAEAAKNARISGQKPMSAAEAAARAAAEEESVPA
jgi:hypothetical protein